jgi:hypothetical protein
MAESEWWAHLKLIEAKRELLLGRPAALHNDLPEAMARIAAALKYIGEARSLALRHHENLAAFERQAQAMLATIGREADATRAVIDALLERSNNLLDEMANSEAAARNAA